MMRERIFIMKKDEIAIKMMKILEIEFQRQVRTIEIIIKIKFQSQKKDTIMKIKSMSLIGKKTIIF